MKYVGFVYRWTNTVNGKMYVGSHVGSDDDGYIGSGLAFHHALKKYRLAKFTREILEYVYSNDVISVEQKYLTKLDCAKSKMYYNISPTAGGGYLGGDMKAAGRKTRLKNLENGSYERIREAMRKNNPNHGGKARLKYIAEHGVPKGRTTPISNEERKNISIRMKANNPVHGIAPWDRLQATEQSLTVWEKADAYYSWWCDNTDKSYYVMFKALGGYEKYTIAHVNMIKRFKAGWNPNEDTSWKEFKERRNK